MRPRLGWATSLLVVALSGCGDGARLAPRSQPDAWSDVDLVPPDTDASRCSLQALSAIFVATVSNHLARCRTCHDATAPPSLLKAPGPPWLYPDDASRTVLELIERGLINFRSPERSIFLGKPSGRVQHNGGVVLPVGSAGYTALAEFVAAVVACGRGAIDAL